MKTNALLNGIVSICKFSKAFDSLLEDVVDRDALISSIEEIISKLIEENYAFDKKVICNNLAENGELFGICKTEPFSDVVSNHLKRNIPMLIEDNGFAIPVKFDYSKPVNIVIEVNGDEQLASKIAQYFLMSMLKANPLLNFRCADFVRGGNFFSKIYNLVTQLRARSGGEVYTKINQLEELLCDLEMAASAAMSRIGGTYSSVSENNICSDDKIEEFVNILYLKNFEYNNSNLERIVILSENGIKNGMSFLIIGEKEVAHKFKNISDFYMCISSKEILVDGLDDLKFNITANIESFSESMLNIVDAVKKIEEIDTSLRNIVEDMETCQSMNSDTLLRIPFAVDKNNIVQYFEIGGEAPSHALLSGSTGSGKSVALHTLIMQIIYNFHPDDVEIWAIDYKAVEFDSYMDYDIPHFRVIAHDTSAEFSLSLIDLLYEEYNLRMKKFLSVGVKNITEYRNKMGERSMPRIVVFIDEFQVLTQTIQTYTGIKDYKTMLENLLRLTRAMGISFVLCSQTIASGLSGLTDSARDQIGCRISLKHDDDNEIRETLMIWGNDNIDVISRAKNLRRGEAIYRRTRLNNEKATDGRPYEFQDVHIIYIDDELKEQMIKKTKSIIKSDFVQKKTIYVRGGGRIKLSEKSRHPIVQFIHNNYEPEDEYIEWYPAAPTTLEDFFKVKLENVSGANILVVGENDDLRDSVVIHSLCGFLMNPHNKIYANFIDEEYSDRKRLIEIIRKIKSSRLVINEGVRSTVNVINSLKKVQRISVGSNIYLWYGLDKLKNELFLFNQEETSVMENEPANNVTDDLMCFLQELNGDSNSKKVSIQNNGVLSFEDCKGILMQAFEMGSENNQFHIVIFNNYKVLKKSGMIMLDNFESKRSITECL